MSLRNLKELLDSTAILTSSKEDVGFLIFYNNFVVELGIMLMQGCKVISYAFHKLKSHDKNYPTHDFELATIIFVLSCGGITYMGYIVRLSQVIIGFNTSSL